MPADQKTTKGYPTQLPNFAAVVATKTLTHSGGPFPYLRMDPFNWKGTPMKGGAQYLGDTVPRNFPVWEALNGPGLGQVKWPFISPRTICFAGDWRRFDTSVQAAITALFAGTTSGTLGDYVKQKGITTGAGASVAGGRATGWANRFMPATDLDEVALTTDIVSPGSYAVVRKTDAVKIIAGNALVLYAVYPGNTVDATSDPILYASKTPITPSPAIPPFNHVRPLPEWYNYDIAQLTPMLARFSKIKIIYWYFGVGQPASGIGSDLTDSEYYPNVVQVVTTAIGASYCEARNGGLWLEADQISVINSQWDTAIRNHFGPL